MYVQFLISSVEKYEHGSVQRKLTHLYQLSVMKKASFSLTFQYCCKKLCSLNKINRVEFFKYVLAHRWLEMDTEK